MKKFKSLCLYCGSSYGSQIEYRLAATKLGQLFAAKGIRLVYGGGSVGLMGAAADACLAAGGEVIGVIPRLLMEKEVGHRDLTELHVVESMHQRKALMTDLSDGFVALPGGFGTLDELFEALTWQQLGYHAKLIGMLNTLGYFDQLNAFLTNAEQQGFLRPAHQNALCIDTDLETLLEKMRISQVPNASEWLSRHKQENSTAPSSK